MNTYSQYLFSSPILQEDLKPEIMEKLGSLWQNHHDGFRTRLGNSRDTLSRRKMFNVLVNTKKKYEPKFSNRLDTLENKIMDLEFDPPNNLTKDQISNRLDMLNRAKRNVTNKRDRIGRSLGNKYGLESNSGEIGKRKTGSIFNFDTADSTYHQRRNEHSMAAISILGDYLNKKKGEHHIAGTSTHEPDKNSLLHYKNRKKYYDQMRKNKNTFFKFK